MSTTITNVTELQAMENDLTEDYVLGNDIDASATSGWNGGEGFIPVGRGSSIAQTSRPVTDDFGYAQQSGSWIIFPDDGIYYNKVNEVTSDNDTTFIQATTNGDYCLLSHEPLDLIIPDDAENIRVYIKANVRNIAAGTSYIQGMLNIGGVEYLVGSNTAVSSQSYAVKTWTMTTYPPGGDWTVGRVFGLVSAGVGVKVSDATPNIRITQIWIQVAYDAIFRGTFDGAGYTISDLFINRPLENYIGLFGWASATSISDVVFTSANITGGTAVGILAGYVEDSTIDTISTAGTVEGNDELGGVIGYADSNYISDCSSSASITGTGTTSEWVGGLIGQSSNPEVIRCSASGSVIGDDYVGGLMGDCTDDLLSQSYATGDVAGDYAVGGLAGYFGGLTMTNCYSRGAVASSGDRIGGLIGDAYGETLSYCYSTGAVTGSTNVGGLIGTSGLDTVIGCFWDTQTSGQATSDEGTGKTTAQMLAFATFYDATWDIGQTNTDRNNGYPFLSWEITETDTIWKIYGEGTYSWDFPDLMDYKGRYVKNAVVDAIRTDVHSEPYIIETQRTDANGTCTFTTLPRGQNVVFHARWGGVRNRKKDEWFFLRVNDIEDGGTGAATAAGARDNLGVDNTALLWELVLGD